MKHLLAGAIAALAFSPIAASAATLSFTGTGDTHVLTNNALGYDGDVFDVIYGDEKTLLNGLAVVSGSALVTYEFLGFEAALNNYAADIDGQFFINKGTDASDVGDTITTYHVDGTGLLDFAFGTVRNGDDDEFLNNGLATPASNNFAIAYKILDANTAVVLFDDRAQGDRDFDDIGMLITIASVPLPASALLLLAGLGGLGAVARRKKA